MLKSLKLTNFQLFKQAEFSSFGSLNIIKGINSDNPDYSSNGAGKSTILNAIFFLIYGDVPGKTLKDLVSFGSTKMSVEGKLEYKGNKIYIKRSIPNELLIKVNEEIYEANTITLKQKYLDDLFGNLDYFKKFRIIDRNKGINLLEYCEDTRSVVTLKNLMMGFIDDMFAPIRKRLLDKKNEREVYNVNKRLYRFHLSEKRLKKLEEGLKSRDEARLEADQETIKQNNACNEVYSKIKSTEQIFQYKQQEAKKLNDGYCPILKSKCSSLTEQLAKLNIKAQEEFKATQETIKNLQDSLTTEKEAYNYYQSISKQALEKFNKTRSYLSKLKEAYKFSAYKYTQADVLLYTEAIKCLDTFSGYYITEWLDQLSIIINDLLKKVNLQIIFTNDKDFLKMKDGTQELKYNLLSDGQKIFLNAVFKLAILLQKGDTNGLILCDEGLSSLDFINLQNFIIICQGLNFQTFIIYQNINDDIENANYIYVERKEGQSNV